MLSLSKSASPFYILILVLFNACSSEPKGDLEAIQMLEKRIILANRELKENNTMVFNATKEKLSEFSTMGKAQIWYPKSQNVQNSTLKMLAYLDILKQELKTSIGYKEKGENGEFSKDNPTVVTKFFRDQDRAKKLYERLIQYQKEADVDSIIYKKYEKGLDSSAMNYVQSLSIEQNYSPSASLAMFNLIENSVLRVESKLLVFCYEHTYVSAHENQFISAIVGQSHSHIKAGEMLEISAGIGYFSNDSKLQIEIGDSLISMNDEGLAIYKIRAPKKIGKHTFPMKLRYIDLNGKQVGMSKQIEYTVVD